MTDAMRLVKNLFKLGLVALQYGIVRLNLDTRSSILREFVSSTQKEKSEVPTVNKGIPPRRESVAMESDASPYIGNGDNMRAYTFKDKLHEWLP